MVALPRPLLTVPTAPASLPPGLVESGAISTEVAFSRTSVVAFRAAGGLSNCARLPAASSDAHRHKATSNLLPIPFVIVSVFLILVRVVRLLLRPCKSLFNSSVSDLRGVVRRP